MACQRTDAPDGTSIKCGLFMGLSSNSTMYSRAIVSFAFLAMAVAANVQPRIDLQMPPTGPRLKNPFETRVVGGNDAPKGNYPYILSLQLLGLQHFCGGSILNELWGVTAAHCVVYSASLVTAKAGKYNLQSKEATEQAVKLLKWIKHEKYTGGVGPYDIALIKFTTPLKLNTNVQAVTLPQPNSKPTGEVWLSGWGSTSTTNSPIMPSKLQHVSMNIIDIKSCNETVIKMTGSSPVDDKSNICTGPISSKPNSACSGDSGGPLVKITGQVKTIVGIVSWGLMPCGSSGAPSVFTRVSYFVDWIKQNCN